MAKKDPTPKPTPKANPTVCIDLEKWPVLDEALQGADNKTYLMEREYERIAKDGHVAWALGLSSFETPYNTMQLIMLAAFNITIPALKFGVFDHQMLACLPFHNFLFWPVGGGVAVGRALPVTEWIDAASGESIPWERLWSRYSIVERGARQFVAPWQIAAFISDDDYNALGGAGFPATMEGVFEALVPDVLREPQLGQYLSDYFRTTGSKFDPNGMEA